MNQPSECADMPAINNEEDRARGLHERVGRIVLRAQRLERALKSLIPIIDRGETQRPLHGFKRRRDQVQRQTLGQLLESFGTHVRSDNPGFGEMLNQVVKDRNDLVHHFATQYRSQSGTQLDDEDLLRKLDAQLDTITMLENLVRGFLTDVVGAVRDAFEPDSERYRQFDSICRDFEVPIVRSENV